MTAYRACAMGHFGEYFATKNEAVANIVGILAGNGIVQFGHPAYFEGKLNCSPEIGEIKFQECEVTQPSVTW